MSLFLSALLIFVLRLIDQSLTTVRALVVTKKPVLGAFIGLVESAIWILAVSQVIKDINDPFLIAAYAFGFAAGTLLGIQLEKFIGDELSTIVVGITEFGLFCEIENYFISGLIHVSDLSRDRYIYDNQANILKGKRTGKTYRIGQKINAQLVSIVPEDRKITLVPK